MPRSDPGDTTKQLPLRAVVDDLHSLLYSVSDVAVELHSNIIGKPPEPPIMYTAEQEDTRGASPVIPLAISIEHMYSHTKYIMDVLVSLKAQL